MIYIAVIGPMGSGKTTLATKLSQRLGFDLLLNTDHEVFDWEQYKGYHDDPAFAPAIQASILNNHFHQIFGCFMKTKNHTVSDSGFVEHAFYNNTKHRVGKYPFSKWNQLEDHHNKLSQILIDPDLTIRITTEPEQIVKNIVNRNRHFEQPDRDITDLLNYIKIMYEEYNRYNADIDVPFGATIDEVCMMITQRHNGIWEAFKENLKD